MSSAVSAKYAAASPPPEPTAPQSTPVTLHMPRLDQPDPGTPVAAPMPPPLASLEERAAFFVGNHSSHSQASMLALRRGSTARPGSLPPLSEGFSTHRGLHGGHKASFVETPVVALPPGVPGGVTPKKLTPEAGNEHLAFPSGEGEVPDHIRIVNEPAEVPSTTPSTAASIPATGSGLLDPSAIVTTSDSTAPSSLPAPAAPPGGGTFAIIISEAKGSVPPSPDPASYLRPATPPSALGAASSSAAGGATLAPPPPLPRRRSTPAARMLHPSEVEDNCLILQAKACEEEGGCGTMGAAIVRFGNETGSLAGNACGATLSLANAAGLAIGAGGLLLLSCCRPICAPTRRETREIAQGIGLAAWDNLKITGQSVGWMASKVWGVPKYLFSHCCSEAIEDCDASIYRYQQRTCFNDPPPEPELGRKSRSRPVHKAIMNSGYMQGVEWMSGVRTYKRLLRAHATNRGASLAPQALRRAVNLTALQAEAAAASGEHNSLP